MSSDKELLRDYNSDLFSSQVLLSSFEIKEYGLIFLPIIPSEIRRAHSKVRNRTTGVVKIRPEQLKNLSLVLVKTLTRLLKSHLSERNVPIQWKASSSVGSFRYDDVHDIGNDRKVFLPSVYKFLTRAILKRIDRTLEQGKPCEQLQFRKEFSTMGHIHTITRLNEVPQGYKKPHCLISTIWRMLLTQVTKTHGSCGYSSPPNLVHMDFS